MISKPVDRVSNTNIFVAYDPWLGRQVTIYQNSVSNFSLRNGMVIPVPHPETVRFHDMTEVFPGNSFFNELRSMFTREKRVTLGHSKTINHHDAEPRTLLTVETVGDFHISLAHSFEDLSRINTDIFELSDGIAEFIPKFYPENWGFIVFCLRDNTNARYSPFCFSHAITTLPEGEKPAIYIPTRHYHPTPEWMLRDPKYHRYMEKLQERPEWHHSIFVYGNVDQRKDSKDEHVQDFMRHDSFTGYLFKSINSWKLSGMLRRIPDLGFGFISNDCCRVDVAGKHQNQDFFIPVDQLSSAYVKRVLCLLWPPFW